MGLITAILKAPLAPVTGTAWIAEKLLEQAEAEMYDESAIRAALIQLEELRDTGELDDDELDAAENELVERLMLIRGFDAGGDHGTGF